MKGERWLLRVGEFLVRRAARRLPGRLRDERHREWAAELPVILHDPDLRPGLRRAARMLGYALDTIRGTALAGGQARHRGAHRGARTPMATFKWLGIGLLVLLVVVGAPGLLILLIMVYGPAAVFWGVGGLCAAGSLIGAFTEGRTRHGWRRVWSYWFPASVLVTSTVQLVLLAAQRGRWPAGSVHLLNLFSSGTAVIDIPTVLGVTVILIRQGIRWSQRLSAR